MSRNGAAHMEQLFSVIYQRVLDYHDRPETATRHKLSGLSTTPLLDRLNQ